MILTELRLNHFRSHRALRLAADARPVAIFGPNGAGKTNILEAVSLLSPGRGLRRAAPEEFSRRGAPGATAPGWKIAATVAGGADPHEIETFAEAGGARSVVLDGKAAPQAALARVLRVLWLVPAMDRLWIEAPEGRRRFLDRVTMSFAPGHAEAALDWERGMRERNRLLRDAVRDRGWYAALEARMAAAGAAIQQNRRAALDRLAAAQDGADSAFPAAELALVEPEGAPPPGDAAALAEALAAGRGADMAAGRTLTGPHRSDLAARYAAKGMPAGQCSTGEQKALLISLVLANARALAAEGAAPVLLLDEVAAHLDEGRRAALYDALCDLGLQAFLTGTGPELFAALGPRARRLAVAEGPDGSVVTEAG